MKNKKILAVILIVVLLALMVFMIAVNKVRSDREQENYEAAVLRDFEKAQAREIARYEKEARENEAFQTVQNAAETYIPGVVFYDDFLTVEQNSQELTYPTIIRTLMLSNVYNIPVGLVDMHDPLYEKTPEDDVWLPVVFVGMDGSWDGNTDSLIRRQQEIIGDRERYIVLGLYTGDKDSRAELEAAMTATYGDKYINLREYFSTFDMEGFGMNVLPEDRAAAEKGETPPGLMDDDGVHLNRAGYKLVAFLTYDRMTELGYFDEILAANEAYYNEKNTH